MNFKVGDTVTVRPGRGFSPGGPFGVSGCLTLVSAMAKLKGPAPSSRCITPSQKGGIANAGGYRVQLRNGTFHYYSEAELRLTPDNKP